MDDQALLREKNKYENDAFPFEIYKVRKYGMSPIGRGFDNLHWHDEIQYTVAVQGDLTIQVNGQNYELKEGQGIFINSQFLHITKAMEENGKYISINFSIKLLSFFLGSLMEQNYVLPYMNDYVLPVIIFDNQTAWKKNILALLKEIEEIYLEKALFAWEYKISVLLCEIWYLILTNVKNESSTENETFKLKQDRIRELLNYVHENFSQQLTLEEIADSANISVSECTRCFKEYTEYSPYEYLIRYRISEAAVLLLKTDHPVSQIAVKTGFRDTSSFIRTFKNRMGTTPLKYRKNHFSIN